MADIGSLLQEDIEFSFDDNGVIEAECVFVSHPTQQIDSSQIKEIIKHSQREDDQPASPKSRTWTGSIASADKLEHIERGNGDKNGGWKKNKADQTNAKSEENNDHKPHQRGETTEPDKCNDTDQANHNWKPVLNGNSIPRNIGQTRGNCENYCGCTLANYRSRKKVSLNANLDSQTCMWHSRHLYSLPLVSKMGLSVWKTPICFIIGILLFLSSSGVQSSLTTVPVDTLVTKGQTARVVCSTNANQEVHWERVMTGSSTEQWVYFGENGFNAIIDDGRFRIDKDETTGRYDLLIADVHPKDSGLYTCIDESGIGQRAAAELIVSDSMHCKTDNEKNGVMGYNVFGLKADSIRMSCNITYKRNIAPSLNWSCQGSEKQCEQPIVTETSTSITSTINLFPTKELNNAKFRCQAMVIGTDVRDNESKLLWESAPIVVLYAEFEETAVLECPGVNWNLICNPACTYTFEKTADSVCKCQYTYYYTSEDRGHSAASVNIACPNSGIDFRVALIAMSISFGILVLIALSFGVFYLTKRNGTNGNRRMQNKDRYQEIITENKNLETL